MITEIMNESLVTKKTIIYSKIMSTSNYLLKGSELTNDCIRR